MFTVATKVASLKQTLVIEDQQFPLKIEIIDRSNVSPFPFLCALVLCNSFTTPNAHYTNSCHHVDIVFLWNAIILMDVQKLT